MAPSPRPIRFSDVHDETIQANIASFRVSPSGASAGCDLHDDTRAHVDVAPAVDVHAQLGMHFRKLTRHIDSWMEHQEVLIKTMRVGSPLIAAYPQRPSPARRVFHSEGSDMSTMRSNLTADSAYGELYPYPISMGSASADNAIASYGPLRSDESVHSGLGKAMRFSIRHSADTASGSRASPVSPGSSLLDWDNAGTAEKKDLDKIQPIQLKRKNKHRARSGNRNFTAVQQSFGKAAEDGVVTNIVHKDFQWPNDIMTPSGPRLASIVSDEDVNRKSQAHAEGVRKTQSMPSHMTSERTAVSHHTSILSRQTEYMTSIAADIVHGNNFPALIAGLILSNAMFVGFEIEWSATHPNEDNTPVFLLVIGYLYSAAFLLELVLRLVADRLAFFCGEGKAWNFLDFALVMISLAEIVLDVVNSARGSTSTQNARLMRLIRITRLLRVIRVVRVIRFVHALRTLVHSILSTLRSLLWAMILLTLIIYVFGIIFTQAATTYFEDNVDSEARLYWSSLGRSLFTLFKSVSGGLSWHDAVQPLGNMHPVYVLLFLVFVTFTYFAVLNVVTGVFCQSAVESAHHDYDLVIQSQLRNRRMYEMKVENLFKEIDKLGTGEITIDEFEKFLESPQTQAYFASLELDTGDAWTLFKLLDVDTSHQLDMEEFLMGCLRLRGSAKAIEMAKMQYENKIMRHKTMEFFCFVEASFYRLEALLTHLGVDSNSSMSPNRSV